MSSLISLKEGNQHYNHPHFLALVHYYYYYDVVVVEKWRRTWDGVMTYRQQYQH